LDFGWLGREGGCLCGRTSSVCVSTSSIFLPPPSHIPSHLTPSHLISSHPTETNIMISTHAASLITEALIKNISDFNVTLAYEAVYRDATVGPVGDVDTVWVLSSESFFEFCVVFCFLFLCCFFFFIRETKQNELILLSAGITIDKKSVFAPSLCVSP
jgi:hypothetical protein